MPVEGQGVKPGVKPGLPRRTNGALKNAIFWMLLMVGTLYLLRAGQVTQDIQPLSYSEFFALLKSNPEAHQIKEAHKIDSMIRGQLADGRRFEVYIPDVDQDLIRLLRENVDNFQVKPPRMWVSLVNLFAPTILFFVLLWFLFYRGASQAGGAGRIWSFGKSRAVQFTGDGLKVTFDDVAGVDEAKEELKEIIEFLKDPKKFQRLGGKIPKGVLLIGPPGTGKTLLAKAVANEAAVPFFSISGSDFVEMFVGVGASVSGETPVLIRDSQGTRLAPIGEFVDQWFGPGQEGFVVPTPDVQTLGFQPAEGHGYGSNQRRFGGSTWQPVSGVYRHRVPEIYEIRYLGGTLRTTGDHSVFVRRHAGIAPKAVSELKPGDVLVDLTNVPEPELEPVAVGLEHAKKVPGTFFEDMPEEKRCQAPFFWSVAKEASQVIAVIRQPYDGYVYDLCGCGEEAFFGGEKPILLHNSRVRDLFQEAKKAAKAGARGAVIFIDEIDAVGRMRFAGIGGGHDEREQTLNALLVEMDGFNSQEGVVLVAASNRPDVLDPALLRPGRFDRTVVIDRPDIKGREAILKVHTRKVKLAPDVLLEAIARQTPGFSGADLANLANEAALLGARRNKDAVDMQDLQDAIERVMAGPERKSRVISKEEKKLVAYHEAGHALLALLTPGADPLHKVSIIPRGTAALGYTMQLPLQDRYIIMKRELLGRLTVLLGGRVSEELNFNEVTTGAQNDLETVTQIARKMVCEFGMSERLGHLTFGKREGLVFLGRDIVEERNFSEQTAQAIDEEVRRIVDDCYLRAKEQLSGHREKLTLLAETLLEKETLDGEAVKQLVGLGLESSTDGSST